MEARGGGEREREIPPWNKKAFLLLTDGNALTPRMNRIELHYGQTFEISIFVGEIRET